MVYYATRSSYYARMIGGVGAGQTVADLEHARLRRQIEAQAYLTANPALPSGLRDLITYWIVRGGPPPWQPGDLAGRQYYPPICPTDQGPPL